MRKRKQCRTDRMLENKGTKIIRLRKFMFINRVPIWNEMGVIWWILCRPSDNTLTLNLPGSWFYLFPLIYMCISLLFIYLLLFISFFTSDLKVFKQRETVVSWWVWCLARERVTNLSTSKFFIDLYWCTVIVFLFVQNTTTVQRGEIPLKFLLLWSPSPPATLSCIFIPPSICLSESVIVVSPIMYLFCVFARERERERTWRGSKPDEDSQIYFLHLMRLVSSSLPPTPTGPSPNFPLSWDGCNISSVSYASEIPPCLFSGL